MLKEHNLGELLDISIRLYFKNFRLFLSISALAIIPSLLPSLTIPVTGPPIDPLTGLPTFPLIAIPAFILSMLVSLFVYGALIGAVSASYLEKEITFSEALRLSLSRYGAILIGTILYFLAIMAASILLILPGIYLAVAYQFFYAVIIIEGLRARAAIGRSRALIKGSWWRVFGINIIFYILTFIILYIILIPVTVVFGIVAATSQSLTPLATFITQAFNAVASAAVTPFLMIGTTLLYYDLRIRREGFDLEVKAEDLTEEVTITT